MNTKKCSRSFVAVFGLAAFTSLSCGATGKPSAPVIAPTHAVVVMSVSASAAAPGPSSPFELLATQAPDAESGQWNAIKDQAFASRTAFIAGLRQMELRVSDQLSELRLKRAASKGGPGTQRSDLAIKELGYARSYIKFMGEELNKATPANWDQQKAKVGETWARTQELYAMGKSGLAS